MEFQHLVPSSEAQFDKDEFKLALVKARRTAFVSRFIVLREARRTRAHRVIEQLEWNEYTAAEELYQAFREIFLKNGDVMEPVDRDLRRALAHADRSLGHFVAEYACRSTTSFVECLEDYERSNNLLFGAEDMPKPGGWIMASDVRRLKTGTSSEGTVKKRGRGRPRKNQG